MFVGSYLLSYSLTKFHFILINIGIQFFSSSPPLSILSIYGILGRSLAHDNICICPD